MVFCSRKGNLSASGSTWFLWSILLQSDELIKSITPSFEPPDRWRYSWRLASSPFVLVAGCCEPFSLLLSLKSSHFQHLCARCEFFIGFGPAAKDFDTLLDSSGGGWLVCPRGRFRWRGQVFDSFATCGWVDTISKKVWDCWKVGNSHRWWESQTTRVYREKTERDPTTCQTYICRTL